MEYDHVSGRLPVDRQDVELIVADRAVFGHQIAAHFGMADRQLEPGELPRTGSNTVQLPRKWCGWPSSERFRPVHVGPADPAAADNLPDKSKTLDVNHAMGSC